MGRARRSSPPGSSTASLRPSGGSTARPVASASPAAPVIDIKQGYDDYKKLMVAVRTYCLAEYERVWGHPWDQTCFARHQHITKTRETAKRAHEVWSQLRRAVKDAVTFVESQGLPPHERPTYFTGEGADITFAHDTVHESFVIHGWLHRHIDAVEDLLHPVEDFEKVHSARSMLAEALGWERVEEPPKPGEIRWRRGPQGRVLKERDMAYISLLVGNEPPSLKKRLEDELLSVEDVIKLEREAINSARVRHDATKMAALAERTSSRTSKGKKVPGASRAKAGPARRS